MRIVGYTDKWTVRPGEGLGLHVSSRADSYDVSIVRLRHGDDNPAGPGFVAYEMNSSIDGSYAGEWHDVPSGSFAVVDKAGELLNTSRMTVAAWICPTAPGGTEQAVIARGVDGFRLFITRDATPAVAIGETQFSLTEPLVANQWYLLIASCDRAQGRIELSVMPRDLWPGGNHVDRASASCNPSLAGWDGPLYIAGRPNGDGVCDHFNGKIDSPTIFADLLAADIVRARIHDCSGEAMAAWDFGHEQSGLAIRDRCGAYPARLVGMPTRAVTGYRWSGRSLSPAEQPLDYTAIHFHDDDRDDAGWPEALRLDIAGDWPSGVYAFHLRTPDGDEDYVPFFVLPRRSGSFAPIAFLAPTFSYLAYGNAHVEDRFLKEPALKSAFPDAQHLYPSQAQDRYVLEQRLNSSYDLHSDGSGVAYVSRLLPQVHFRPKVRFQFLHLLKGSPHQFNADLHVIDWLHAKGFEHDVLTDEALHLEGVDLLTPYRVILTGTHPEYWSGDMLDAMQAYLQGGGRVMYLGGNGFFWVTTMHPQAPHVLEIRKWGGTRAWDAPPGERYHSTTGEIGGLWRNRGRAPQKLVGVGFTAQGFNLNAPYRRTEASYEGDLAFLFDGIAGDVFGDIPSLVMGHGAAGFELDRVDMALGSPPTTVCLAQSFGHGGDYQVAVEDLLATPPATGTANPLVRSDIAYVRYPNNGAVFSVGSISYCGCLSYNNYDNDISRLTENVLRHFLGPD